MESPVENATGSPGSSLRRRGEILTRAIYRATLAELAETSFEDLSFDKIALRAGAGKASLYRRWTSPGELVLESLTDPSEGLADPIEPDTGSVGTDLVELLDDFARMLDQPHGRALRPLMTQRPRHPELFDEAYRQLVRPRLDLTLAVLRRAADRGEIAAEAVTSRIAMVGTRLVIGAHMDGGTVPRSEVEAIVSEVLLPLLTSPAHGARPGPHAR